MDTTDSADLCKADTASVIIALLAGVIAFCVGAKLSDLYPRFFRWLGKGKADPLCFQKLLVEVKKATVEMAHEWIELMKEIEEYKGDREKFANRIESDLEVKIAKLGENITVSLEEEFLRNDQRFAKMKRTIETVQEEILSMKNFLQSSLQKFASVSSQKNLEEKNSKQITFTDNFAQTEHEIKKRVRDVHSKNANNIEHDAPKLITMVKKCLLDIMKDTKLHLSIDREEENRELQTILTKLTEDRDDIKKSIMQAFTIAAEQAKRNYDQFGNTGQDAMRYIAIMNEKTNTMMKMKLEEADYRLKEILNALNRQIFDVDAVKDILGNIDGQFDEIFQRVEVGCQRNTEHCEEMAQSLEKTANNCASAVSELENVAKGLSIDTQKMRKILIEIVNLKQTGKQENEKEINEIMHYDSLTNETTQDLRELSEKQRNMIFIYSMIQSCWENMTHMNSRVENGCEAICKLIDALERKLGSLNESVERLDDVIRNIDLENFDDRLMLSHCPDEGTEEFIENVMQSNIGDVGDADAGDGDAGDGQSQVLQNIRNKLSNGTLAQKIQNVIAIDKEVKMIEIILRKVCEKRNVKFKKEILYHHVQNNISEPNEESLTLMDGNQGTFDN